MTMDGSKIQVNGQGTPKGASAVIGESVSQAPIIDDSLIADDHEGLPLISAVFSLAQNGKTEEASISGTNLGVSSPISPKTSTQSGSLNTSSPINAGPLPSNKAFSSDNEIQRQGASASVGVGSNSVQSFVSLTKNDTTNTTGSATLSSCALQREPGLTAAEAESNSKSSAGGAVTHVQTAGNMVRLVKLVNSVSKVDQLRANSPLTTSAALIKKSPPSIVLPSGSPSSPAKPGLQLPRQIAMKQPAQGTRQTSIILNLKPGEPIPKAINLLSPDGKSVMLLTLSEGGKQLVTPSGAPATDGKILIPIPPNVTVSSPMTSKPTTLLNKVYPIAPNPVKTTPLPSQGISSSSVITSIASPPKQPVVHSRAAYSSGSSSIGSFSNASESRVSMVTPAASSTNLASPSVQSAVSTKLETADPKPSSFDEDKSTGLSPQEAKIQRLKQLIQQQEDAVNKLREKRRLELEQIRNPSSPSKVDDGAATDDSLRTERPALAEQKRPASPSHMFAQCITAMAHHRYLELEGGHKLVEFIVRQCAISDEEKTRRPVDADVSPQALQRMCENILYLLTTTVDVMEPVLWPYLLECLVPEPFTFAMNPLCRCICHLATKRREEQAEDFTIDFEEKTNIPRPVAIISRLLVMSGHPLPGGCRGLHVLKLLKALSPILEPSLVGMWDTVIPKLTLYLEENSENKGNWKQKTWEDLVLKFVSKSVDEVDSEGWTCALAAEMAAQMPLYTNFPEEKNFLFKCIGVVLSKVNNKEFVQNHLNVMFSSVKHTSQLEREGCAIGIGFSAGTNLDQVLLKLEQVSKNEMTKKSSGILSFMKDKSDSDTERIKSTVLLCYGYAVLYAPPGLVTSRLETNIFRAISRHYGNVKDTSVKQNLIRVTELIGKALEPSRLQQPEFVFTKRQELVNHMLAYMKAEPPSVITTETRALAMDACASLAKLKPRFSDAEVLDIVKTSTDCVFSVHIGDKPKQSKEHNDNDKDPWNLLKNALESLQRLLREILLQEPVPSTLENVLRHIQHPWLLSASDLQRERAVNAILSLLESFRDNMLITVGGKSSSFMLAGPVLGRLIPRCTDPVIAVRQTSVDCVQCVLKVAARFEGYSLESKDELVDALPTLKKRAAEDDANILFSVANDLSKVVAKKLPNDSLPSFVETLLEGLTDSQSHCASGSCVVLNSIVRIRGQELRKDVVVLVKDIHSKLQHITHAQTRTGTLRVFRTLASHHLVPVMTAILEFPLPYDQHVMDVWRTMAGDSNLALSVFDYVLDLSLRTLPYQEKPKPKNKKETIRVATPQPIAITCGLTEMFRSEEIGDLVSEHFPRLFAMTLLRLGTSVGLLPPEPPSSSGKEKHKGPKVEPLGTALECFKELIVRCKYETLMQLIGKEDGWALFEDDKTFPDGVVVVARALCKAAPQQVPKVAEQLNSTLSSVYDAQRVVVAAFFSELIDQTCGGKVSVVEVLMNSLLSRLVDSSHVVRKFCIRGLGNISSVEDSQLEKYSTTILSAMMAGMDDKDDQEDEITLESMSGLAKILAKLDENNVRQILINICLRIRPCFEKEKSAVRAAAFTLFGKLSRFGDGPSKAPFLEQVHTNLVSVLLHLNEEVDVTKACKSCLRSTAPLIGSDSINQMFQKHLLEEGHLHYGEFMNDLSRLIIVDLADKISFYVMGCVSFFKSSRDDIKANAALFTGFILGNLPKDRQYEISKDHVCGALILLLKDPSPKVRCKAAEAISLLYDY